MNAHGNGEEVSAPGTPTARLTGIPKAVQVLQVKATDSGRAELNWTRPANGTDKVTANSATATFSQIQGYRIEVCRTVCGEEANWYALVPNTRELRAQVRAPGAGAGRDPGEPLPGAGDQHQRQDGPVVERGDAGPDGGGGRLSADAGRLDAVGPVPGAQPGRQQALCALHEHRHGLDGQRRALPPDEEGRREAGPDRPGGGQLVPGGHRLLGRLRLGAQAVAVVRHGEGGAYAADEPLCGGRAGRAGLRGRGLARRLGHRAVRAHGRDGQVPRAAQALPRHPRCDRAPDPGAGGGGCGRVRWKPTRCCSQI